MAPSANVVKSHETLWTVVCNKPYEDLTLARWGSAKEATSCLGRAREKGDGKYSFILPPSGATKKEVRH